MKLKKYELVRAIDKAKSVVPKKPVISKQRVFNCGKPRNDDTGQIRGCRG